MGFCRALVHAAGLLAVHAVADVAYAQRLSITPEIGLYVPTETLLEAANGTIGELEAGPSFGLRLGISLGSRLSLSVGGNYVPTTFAIRPEGGDPERRDARLFTGAGQLVLHLLPATSPLLLFLNGGVGVISRGGIAFTDDSLSSDMSGVLGGGVGINLGGITLLAGADFYSYTAQYTGTTAVASELKQLDIQIRLGLGLFGGGLSRERR
jgi:hypothetical protein